MASRVAISGGRRRTSAPSLSATTSGFPVSLSRIVTERPSTAFTAPDRIWKEPETTCSAASFAPSADRSPSTRTWSPTCSSANVDGRASANRTESAAYRLNVGLPCAVDTTSVRERGQRADLDGELLPAAASIAVTTPETPRRRQSAVVLLVLLRDVRPRHHDDLAGGHGLVARRQRAAGEDAVADRDLGQRRRGGAAEVARAGLGPDERGLVVGAHRDDVAGVRLELELAGRGVHRGHFAQDPLRRGARAIRRRCLDGGRRQRPRQDDG